MQKARKRKTRNRTFWTEQKAQAARLVFSGDYTNREIAEQLGVAERTVNRWKARQEFHQHLAVLRNACFEEEMRVIVEQARERDFLP